MRGGERERVIESEREREGVRVNAWMTETTIEGGDECLSETMHVV